MDSRLFALLRCWRPPVARGAAWFLGAFTLLNLLGNHLHHGFDANLWWVDLRALPPPVAATLLTAAGMSLLAWAAVPRAARWTRVPACVAAAGMGGVAAVNAGGFYKAWGHADIRPGVPVPLSALLALGLLLLAREAWQRREPSADGLRTLAAVGAWAVLFPLLQMLCFGGTDYRRPADAIVVLGARAYADGRPSPALEDRVRTACALYREGWAPRLVLSGGPGDGTLDEPGSMRRLALSLGVPDAALVLDHQGVNSEATVRNTPDALAHPDSDVVLVVSHAYHLPRLKLAYQRHGREVFTVPAQDTHVLVQLPFLVLREVAALWTYYLRPLSA